MHRQRQPLFLYAPWVGWFLPLVVLLGVSACGDSNREGEPEKPASERPSAASSHAGPVAVRLFDRPFESRDLEGEPVAADSIQSFEVAQVLRTAVPIASSTSRVWTLEIPDDPHLEFGVALDPASWVLLGDGIRAELVVVDRKGSEAVWSQWLHPHDRPDHRRWIDASVDLSRWSGERVRLRFHCYPSPEAHSIFRPRSRERGEVLLLSSPRIHSTRHAAPNVLLVVVDTLRDDGLHHAGNPRETSPNLDRFAMEAVQFTRAYAPSSWTHPSVGSLLSGWSPWEHGLGSGPAGTTSLDPKTPLLAEDFRRRGYATAAVSNNRIVSPDEGFDRGFDHFDLRCFEEYQIYGAQRVSRYGLEWLERHREGPFFLYLHYFDPHDRYQAPPPFTRRFVDPGLQARVEHHDILQGRPNAFRKEVAADNPKVVVRPKHLKYLRALYDGEVSYVDHWLGRVLDQLDDWGLREETIVVITSDHGEEFYEHGFFKHGHSLYDELVSVPLLLRVPGSGIEPQRRNEPVSLMDLAPTLRSLAGLETIEVTGRDLAPALREGGDLPPRPLLLTTYSRAPGEWAGRRRGLVEWPWKWIENTDDGSQELYDLEADPGERENRAADLPERVAAMQARCEGIYGPMRTTNADSATVDPARLEKLKAMGYVH